MKTLYYDYDADRRINSLGVAQTGAQKVVYQSKDRWTVCVRHNAAGVLAGVDLSAATAWRAAVAADYNHDTEPCCRVLDASIDASAATAGDISFPLDANTAEFLAAIAGKASLATPETMLELVGLDADAAQIFYFAFPVELVNTLDPSGGEPPEPVGDHYTKTEVDALVNGKALESDVAASLALKVDKATGKGLSTEDYTSTEKTKLAGVAAGATNYTHPASHAPAIITQDSSNRFVTDTEKSTWNGKADLEQGKVPASQLPSFVDDIIEVANFAALPSPAGEAGKIYVTLDDDLTYRWGGTAYTEVSKSLALGETSSTAYRGDRGATAYSHSQASGNPHSTAPADIGAEPANANIQAHISATNNPHGVDAADVGNGTAQWNADKLQGRAVASTAPTDKQGMVWNSTAEQWEPGAAGHVVQDAGTSKTARSKLNFEGLTVTDDPENDATKVAVPVTTYPLTFTSADLVNGVLAVAHNLNDAGALPVTIFDNSRHGVVYPSEITYVDANNLAIDFSGMTVTGTWTLKIGAGSGGAGSGESGGMANPMTTEGDLIVGGADGAPARLAKGITGQVLKQGATSPEWGTAPAGGGMWTLVERWEPSEAASSHTFSSLNGDSDRRYMLVSNVLANGTTGQYFARPNNDSGSNYSSRAFDGYGDSTFENNRQTWTGICIGYTGDADQTSDSVQIWAKSGKRRVCQVDSLRATSNTAQEIGRFGVVWSNTADNITSLVVSAPSGGNFGVGSCIELWKLAQ